MKECLNCKKEYEAKRETSKFCSTNCRVKYHNQHGKPKNAVTPLQMQVLYNSILDAVNQINFKNGQPEAIAAIFEPKPNIPAQSYKPVPKVAAEAIMRKYVEDRRDCSCDEEYLNWLERLDNDERLTSKQRELVKNTH